MTGSAFLAEFMGLYIMIVSAAFVLRHDSFIEYAQNFADDISLRYSVALVELAAGLGVVLTNRVLELSYRGAVTVVGGMMVIEAVFHLLAEEEHERRLVEGLEDGIYWKVFGILSLLFGVYLVSRGFAIL